MGDMGANPPPVPLALCTCFFRPGLFVCRQYSSVALSSRGKAKRYDNDSGRFIEESSSF